jgi:uncharacterized integral membrane protein (TIGR00697 family)
MTNNTIKKEYTNVKMLLRAIPSVVVAFFAVSVVCMNILANKTIVQTDWIALDGGIAVSWLSFLCMDIITKYFGPKASNITAILATIINLLVCLIFFAVSIIPSTADDYTALDGILGGTWFILLGSTVAFIASAFINNLLNWLIGKCFRKNPNGKLAFIASSYISTFIGQFADNIIFAVIVFVFFAPIFWDGFHWTLIQCVTCALTGAVAELLMEVLFSPIGYRITKKWREDNVGKEYFEFIGKEQ